jgi:hypothetical protein
LLAILLTSVPSARLCEIERSVGPSDELVGRLTSDSRGDTDRRCDLDLCAVGDAKAVLCHGCT